MVTTARKMEEWREELVSPIFINLCEWIAIDNEKRNQLRRDLLLEYRHILKFLKRVLNFLPKACDALTTYLDVFFRTF